MNQPDKHATEQARATAREIAQRLDTEPAFREEVEARPIDALKNAGMREEWIADFLRENENKVEPEVAGFMMDDCDTTCYEVTCLCTCPETTVLS